MRIRRLIIGDETYTDNFSITTNLHKNNIHWLDNAEIENAILEIKDGKLYWNSGIWYFGDWEYGIFLDGTFMYGNWYNGIFYNGLFLDGVWHDGIFMNGTIINGEFIKGEFRKGVKIQGGDFNKENTTIITESIISYSDYK